MQQVATNPNLDRIGRAHRLERYINLRGIGSTSVNVRAMSTTVEAILGAVWYDGGLTAAETVMVALGLVPS